MESNSWLIDTFTRRLFVVISTFIITFLIVLTYSGEWLLQGGVFDVGSTTTNIILSVLISTGAISSVTAIKLLLTILDTRDTVTAHQSEIVYRITQIIVFMSAVLLIINTWNIDVSNVLFGAGVLGIIAGLAARNALSSVLSGIIIMSTDMFRVGHWLKFNGKFGKVEKITFFNTHIVSPQNESHILPNDLVTQEDITNFSGEGALYRVDLLVSVGYNESVETVLDVCDDQLQKLEEDTSVPIIYRSGETTIKEFDDSGIVLSLKVWIKTPNPYRINKAKTSVIESVHERFKQEEIEIPYPHRKIVSQKNDKD